MLNPIVQNVMIRIFHAQLSLTFILIALALFGCKRSEPEVVIPLTPSIPEMHIDTEDGEEVKSKEKYVNCAIRINGNHHFEDLQLELEDGAKIRGRGNSTWKYYDKKPYKIKLDKKLPLLGMKEGKSWVLLANYRDPSHFMNAISFDMARFLNMPYTNSNRFIEVYLNDEYIGMYQITEHVHQHENRVNIDQNEGVLLSLDLDDGPGLSPTETDNFYSQIYELPVAIKHPNDPTPTQIATIRDDFAVIERLIANQDFVGLSARMDIGTLIDFLIIQELTRNVELVSPRSMYLFRDEDRIYRFGPVWDFDGGFAFNWASMSHGHEYFGSQSWLMGSSNPSYHPWDAYNHIPDFFVSMFGNDQFLTLYKARWNEINELLLPYCFEKLEEYITNCEAAMARNEERWPIDKDYNEEIARLKSWLTERVTNYSTVVEGY